MNFLNHFSVIVASVILAGAALSSCNKDEEWSIVGQPPAIVLDNDTGVYMAKVGQSITIAPEFSNVSDNQILWITDMGQVVAAGPVFTSTWPTEGTYYYTIVADNGEGRTEEEIRVDVLQLTPPVISLAISNDCVKVAPGEDCAITPDIRYADLAPFSIQWFVADELVCNELTYHFNSPIQGVFPVKIVATNADGSTTRCFDIIVEEGLSDYKVQFMPASYSAKEQAMYTFVGRRVCLVPAVSGFDAPMYQWQVNGEVAECAEPQFSFTPDAAGRYVVRVTVSDQYDEAAADGDASVAVAHGASAEIEVMCVDTTEESRFRRAVSGTKASSTKVFEYIPAPGQFINDTGVTGGMTGGETTAEAAALWAQQRLEDGRVVSLGAFGGYISVGFDHSVPAGSGSYDFSITGNAFIAAGGGSSNEPGIVWVMQDVNGNGKPDDGMWYELKGCMSGTVDATERFSVTYFRPDGAGMPTPWQAFDGTSGAVAYMPFMHFQDFYYPAWIEDDSYTLWGTKLAPRNLQDPFTGQWSNNPYEWGYADNCGSDNLREGGSGGEGQVAGFSISNAVYPDGSPANLQYVDFVKVQSAVLAQSGALGEVSTEVSGFTDLSIGD